MEVSESKPLLNDIILKTVKTAQRLRGDREKTDTWDRKLEAAGGLLRAQFANSASNAADSMNRDSSDVVDEYPPSQKLLRCYLIDTNSHNSRFIGLYFEFRSAADERRCN